MNPSIGLSIDTNNPNSANNKNSDIQHRQLTHGQNTLNSGDNEHGNIYMTLLFKFMDQLKQPLNLLLLLSALISLWMGQWDDCISITMAILIVVTVAFIQEYRSEKSLEALTQLVPHQCHVLRSGKWLLMDARDVVYGDVVQFHTGDRIPADLRVIEVGVFLCF